MAQRRWIQYSTLKSGRMPFTIKTPADFIRSVLLLPSRFQTFPEEQSITYTPPFVPIVFSSISFRTLKFLKNSQHWASSDDKAALSASGSGKDSLAPAVTLPWVYIFAPDVDKWLGVRFYLRPAEFALETLLSAALSHATDSTRVRLHLLSTTSSLKILYLLS